MSTTHVLMYNYVSHWSQIQFQDEDRAIYIRFRWVTTTLLCWEPQPVTHRLPGTAPFESYHRQWYDFVCLMMSNLNTDLFKMSNSACIYVSFFTLYPTETQPIPALLVPGSGGLCGHCHQWRCTSGRCTCVRLDRLPSPSCPLLRGSCKTPFARDCSCRRHRNAPHPSLVFPRHSLPRYLPWPRSGEWRYTADCKGDYRSAHTHCCCC